MCCSRSHIYKDGSIHNERHHANYAVVSLTLFLFLASLDQALEESKCKWKKVCVCHSPAKAFPLSSTELEEDPLRKHLKRRLCIQKLSYALFHNRKVEWMLSGGNFRRRQLPPRVNFICKYWPSAVRPNSRESQALQCAAAESIRERDNGRAIYI